MLLLPDCVKVARQTLTLFVWVRILVGQPPVPSPFDSSEGILNGMWLSLVERCVRDAEVAGSNPVIPTISSVLNQPESWMRTLDFFLPFCASLYV